jgi:hypothetical protein
MKGNIVVVPFPSTDLSSFKRRPALVLHETEFDIVVAYILDLIGNALDDIAGRYYGSTKSTFFHEVSV